MLYNGMLENNCSEQASRMAAMESSTKNAKEMLAKLTLSYNRCTAVTNNTDPFMQWYVKHRRNNLRQS